MFFKLHKFLVFLFIKTLQFPRILIIRIASYAHVTGKPIRRQPVMILGAGKVEFLGKVTIGYFPSPQFLSTYAHLEVRKRTARIIIRNGTHINNNFCAISEHTSIEIGENCRIGHNVEMLDSNFHGLEVNERSKSLPEWSKPILVGNNVFIGSNVKILKGVTVGDGSVIASGSVVTKDIPAMTIAAGSPARVIRHLRFPDE
jgi:acetyltransferase-like isoleucine patch superfamily enzyme